MKILVIGNYYSGILYLLKKKHYQWFLIFHFVLCVFARRLPACRGRLPPSSSSRGLSPSTRGLPTSPRSAWRLPPSAANIPTGWPAGVPTTTWLPPTGKTLIDYINYINSHYPAMFGRQPVNFEFSLWFETLRLTCIFGHRPHTRVDFLLKSKLVE